MALTAAERAKRYRDNKKKNPETHAAYLQKEKERYKQRKAKGEYDHSTKSAREMNLIRRKWRLKKRDQREKKKAEKRGLDFISQNTPTASPVRQDPVEIPIDHNSNQNERNSDSQKTFKNNIKPHQALSGEKRRNRNKARASRLITRLQNDKEHFKTLWECSRKRVQRLQKQMIEKPKTKKSSKQNLKHIPFKKMLKRIRKSTGHSVTWQIQMRRKVQQFLEEDINSTLCPGKKDTITRGKKKMQKRYLNDTLLNLFKAYTERHENDKISYVSFCRFRPFWVTQRKLEARDTCLCRLHENVRFRVEKLTRLKVVSESNPDKLMKDLVCDINSKACAYGECSRCRKKTLNVSPEYTEERFGEQVTFQQWVNRTEEIATKEGPKTVQKTVKLTEQSTTETLLQDTTELLRDRYIRHIFNIRHQFHTLKQVKENLTQSEAVINVDFSENYNCKLSEEIQSMHFGGSRAQLSLHTVVVYTKCKTESFCTVSDNTKHGPGAIWAHMQPVLKFIRDSYPEIQTLHFISDGPCTQYRSKNNFYMYHREIIQNHDFTLSTWNFTESGHGKSAADGVGGTVKRTADRIVASGIDIPDVDSFYRHVGGQLHSVRIFIISSADIETFTKSIPSTLHTVKGTMKLHQVLVSMESRGVMRLKLLSCFCKWPQICDCYPGDASEHQIVPYTNIADEDSDNIEEQNDCEVSNDIDGNSTTDLRPHPDIIGTWCAVRYEGGVYPGVIQDVDAESAEVKCMSRIGVNRYFGHFLTI